QGDAGIGNLDDADEGGVERLTRVRGQVLEAPDHPARHRAGRLVGPAGELDEESCALRHRDLRRGVRDGRGRGRGRGGGRGGGGGGGRASGRGGRRARGAAKAGRIFRLRLGRAPGDRIGRGCLFDLLAP